MATAFRRNRIRYGLGQPSGAALSRGELVVQTGGGQPRLWVGLGGGGLAKFDGSVVTAGSVESTERGGVLYNDEQHSSGTTVLLLRAPTKLTLRRLTAKTGSGTCNLNIVANSHTYPALSATSASSSLVYQDQPSIPEGAIVSMQTSNATNLTAISVQLDWLEG